jgi:hypothetical protein
MTDDVNAAIDEVLDLYINDEDINIENFHLYANKKKREDIELLSTISDPMISRNAERLVNDAYTNERVSSTTLDTIKHNLKEYMINLFSRSVSHEDPLGVIGIGCPGSGKSITQLISLAILCSEKVGGDSRSMLEQHLLNHGIRYSRHRDAYDVNNVIDMLGIIGYLNDFIITHRGEYVTIDQDDIIQYFFNLNEFRPIVFGITSELFTIALRGRRDIIYASTGKDPSHIKDGVFNEFHNYGYNAVLKTSATHVTRTTSVILSVMDTALPLCKEQILTRCVDNYKKGKIGRFILDKFFNPMCADVNQYMAYYKKTYYTNNYIRTDMSRGKGKGAKYKFNTGKLRKIKTKHARRNKKNTVKKIKNVF